MGVQFQDYYEMLGVARTASQDEIQKAFRKLARKYHPDVNKGKESEDKFKQLNEAYEVLKDPEKREKYDTLGANWHTGQDFTPPPGWGEGHFSFHHQAGDASEFGLNGFSDFFETLFGERMSGSGAGSQTMRHSAGPWTMRGQDHEAEITISLEDAYHGASRTVALQTIERGPDDVPQQQTKQYAVKIPAGVTDGARIRLAGKGGPGVGDGPAGDLLLRIRVAAHPVFQLEGRNLRVDLPLAPWEAALGAKVEVPTLDGSVSMSVPPGAQSGKRFRLRGKGLPNTKGSAGDIYATVQIVVPETLTTDERELFQKLSDTSSFRPRSPERQQREAA